MFEVVSVKETKLVNLSMEFSVCIIKLYEKIKGHHALVNQLERSFISINTAKSQ